MYRVTLLIVGLAAVSCYTLFDEKNPLSSENADVRIVRRSKRDTSSQVMPVFYDIILRVSGEDVATRLNRHEDSSAHFGYRPDWAGYTSRDVRGLFIVRRNNLTNMEIEGYMVHDGVRYLLQPNTTAGGHVIHKIAFHEAGLTFTSGNKFPSVSKFVQSQRRKRDRALVMDVYYKCRFVFDLEAKSRLERTLYEILQPTDMASTMMFQMGTLIWLYVSAAFEEVKKFKIVFQVLPMIILTEERPSESNLVRLNDGIRRTVCSVGFIDLIKKNNQQWREVDHTIHFTGYNMLDSNGHPGLKVVDSNKVCSQDAFSIIEFTMNLNILRHVAQLVVISMGAQPDGLPNSLSSRCPASDYFLMSPLHVLPHRSLNTDRYSECTEDWLHARLSKSFPPTSFCFARSSSPSPNYPVHDLGQRLSFDRQCQLQTNSGAALDQITDDTLCRVGILCTNGQHIIPFRGTRCQGALDDMAWLARSHVNILIYDDYMSLQRPLIKQTT